MFSAKKGRAGRSAFTGSNIWIPGVFDGATGSLSANISSSSREIWGRRGLQGEISRNTKNTGNTTGRMAETASGEGGRGAERGRKEGKGGLCAGD